MVGPRVEALEPTPGHRHVDEQQRHDGEYPLGCAGPGLKLDDESNGQEGSQPHDGELREDAPAGEPTHVRLLAVARQIERDPAKTFCSANVNDSGTQAGLSQDGDLVCPDLNAHHHLAIDLMPARETAECRWFGGVTPPRAPGRGDSW